MTHNALKTFLHHKNTTVIYDVEMMLSLRYGCPTSVKQRVKDTGTQYIYIYNLITTERQSSRRKKVFRRFDLLRYKSLIQASGGVNSYNMASEIVSNSIDCSTARSSWKQWKHQCSSSLVLCHGGISDRWIPLTKGQYCGNCVHGMTSSRDQTVDVNEYEMRLTCIHFQGSFWVWAQLMRDGVTM